MHERPSIPAPEPAKRPPPISAVPPKKPGGPLELVATGSEVEMGLSTTGIADVATAGYLVCSVTGVMKAITRDGRSQAEADAANAANFNHAAIRMHALEPADALEGMTVALMVAVQDAAMVALHNTTIPDVCSVRDGAGARAERLLRSFISLADLRARLRGGVATQKVIVERVFVAPGAQAVIGTVTATGGGAGGGPVHPSEAPHAQA